MKPNGILILVLVIGLAAVTGVAWTAGDEKPVCPLTGEPATCPGDGPHGPRGMAGPPHGPERMAAALDLTEEQQAAMQELMAAERDAMREQMETALAGILTPEQLVKLEEIKARRESRGDADHPGRMGRTGRRGGDRGGMAERHLERMTANLDLTPEQQDRIRRILEEAAPPPRAETREKIRAVLTPEQQAKMDRHRGRCLEMGDLEGRDRVHGPGGRGTDLPRRLARQLELTDEQRAAVREMMAGMRSERREEMRSRIEALLTPEQREKLGQLHQNRLSPTQ